MQSSRIYGIYLCRTEKPRCFSPTIHSFMSFNACVLDVFSEMMWFGDVAVLHPPITDHKWCNCERVKVLWCALGISDLNLTKFDLQFHLDNAVQLLDPGSMVSTSHTSEPVVISTCFLRVKAWSPIERLHIVNSMSVLDNTGRRGGTCFYHCCHRCHSCSAYPHKGLPNLHRTFKAQGDRSQPDWRAEEKREKGDTDGRMELKTVLELHTSI